MNIDIRLKNNFFRHPKTRFLEAKLGPCAPLYLIKIWIYASEFFPDGVLRDIDPLFLEKEIGWPQDSDKKLVQVLIDIGFLETDGCNIIIHDWQEHNSFASESENRGNKGRFSKLKQVCPQVAQYLQALGINSISKENYKLITSSDDPLSAAKSIFKPNQNRKLRTAQQNPQGTQQDDPEVTTRVDFSSNTNTNTNTNTNNLSNTDEREKQSEDMPSMEFMELREFYDRNARPEGPRAGWIEFKMLKRATGRRVGDGYYPGIHALMDDIGKRIEGGFWDNGYAPSLAKYLKERTWEQKITSRQIDGRKSFGEIEAEHEERRKEAILKRLKERQEELENDEL